MPNDESHLPESPEYKAEPNVPSAKVTDKWILSELHPGAISLGNWFIVLDSSSLQDTQPYTEIICTLYTPGFFYNVESSRNNQLNKELPVLDINVIFVSCGLPVSL